jgi:hypothetical protein
LRRSLRLSLAASLPPQLRRSTARLATRNIHTIGIILLVVGAVGGLLSLIFWSS